METSSSWEEDMSSKADFSVYDQRGQLAAIAEAKKKVGTNRAWAAQWAKNYLSHSHVPSYLLLVTPDKLYLWENPAAGAGEPNPRVANAREVFQMYLERAERSTDELSGEAFELLVGTWLSDILRDVWHPAAPDQEETLAASGFIRAVKDGHLEADTAA